MTRGPFPARTLSAVSACARALGAADPDAAIAGAPAATIGALRAFADRLVLRERFHDARAHAAHRPADTAAASVYDALELARLDTLGVGWLPGIARNLLAHPGAEEDGPRWLALSTFSGAPPPAVKAPMVERARTALTPELRSLLDRLAALVRDPERFAPEAAAWSTRAAPMLPRPSGAARTAVPLPVRQVIRELPSRGDPGAVRAALHRPDDGPRQFAGTGNAGAGARVASSGAPGSGYRVFTTAHDRVVHAAALVRREELAQLRVQLQDELTGLRSVIGRIAKRLMRVLMAQQARRWQFDLDEGLLDSSRLAAFVASGGRARPFKQETESPFPSTVVSLLIDHSGSMRGRPMQIAALTVEVFARVLERCGVRFEVLGFTTREWDGGEPAREWAAQGYPENPGRLNGLEHIVVKAADVPWRRARVGLGLCLRDEMLKENIDGEAVAWAHGRLLSRPERRRILVVVSDGTPMDEATLAANGHEYLDLHLAEVVEGIEDRSPVQLAAIGIGHDVSRFYRNATRIRRIEDLGPALTQRLVELIGGSEVRRGGRRHRAARQATPRPASARPGRSAWPGATGSRSAAP